ncbi:PEPxxWA-CTERM sorting domain-containing protein [Sphingomonas flavescens]|uniref:PEPxxWA-CTERM sorting domain-containing protein n=1 Tax=Sphingomonas flavescens TaxID=3132797 RepID=UPI0028060B49|nr:PEPxxWA-CTERM sorting domain-containing protein [Sphingomonas limnosediminicola]
MMNSLKGALTRPAAIACVLAAAATPQIASAQVYTGTFTALNGSSASGTTTLTLDANAKTLNVMIHVMGLEPGGVHVGHIHGRVDANGMPLDSTTPTLAQDTDRDGYVELAEGQVTYGPILVDFMNTDPNMDGVVDFNRTFNLLDPTIYGAGFNIMSLLGPNLDELSLREIVLHGLTVPAGPGAGTPGEVNGTNGYLTVLPVASAELVRAVPEPATWAMMLLGFGGIGVAMRRSRNRKGSLQIA